ncbi:MAG: alpha-L-arabinofuranosidase [Phycisphaerales bacterium]
MKQVKPSVWSALLLIGVLAVGSAWGQNAPPAVPPAPPVVPPAVAPVEPITVWLAFNGPEVPMRPALLGHNMTPIDWHGATGRPAVFWDDKTNAPDPSWQPLMDALPLHRLRLNMGNDFPWEQDIGPVDQRKPIPHGNPGDPYNPVYRTQPGLDEFLRWAQAQTGHPDVTLIASPLRPVKEIADLVAYCNATTGPMAELRAANGHPEPYNIKYWEMGNESDWWFGPGKWGLTPQEKQKEKQKQGKLFLDEYIDLCRERIAAMRAVDPTIRIYPHAATVARAVHSPYWREWHLRILKELGDQIDGLAVHPYPVTDAEVLNVPYYLTHTIDVLIDDLKAYGPPGRKLDLWLSEFGRWYDFQHRPWSDAWNLEAATQAADMLLGVMVRPEVSAANTWCLNHRGPWRLLDADWDQGAGIKYGTPVYQVYLLLNQAMLPRVQPLLASDYGKMRRPTGLDYAVRAVLMSDPQTGRRVLLAVNRSPDQSAMLRLYAHLPKDKPIAARRLLVTGPDMNAVNSPASPNEVALVAGDEAITLDVNGAGEFELPPHCVAAWSWTENPTGQ